MNCSGIVFPIPRVLVAALVAGCAWLAPAAPAEDVLKPAVEGYFTNLFTRLSQATARQPTVETFREVMRPLIDGLPGLYDATLVDTNWTIRQTFFRHHFAAVGYSIRKVPAMAPFRELMEREPGPQLSEPAGGGLIYPRVICMRVPVLREGRPVAILSLMVQTDAFLRAVGLAECRALRITCRGQVAETRGRLSAGHRTVRLNLPATDWVIDYE